MQPAQLEQPAESRRDRAGQAIAVEVEGCQTGEVAELRRDRAGQPDPVRQGLRCAEDQVGELRADRAELGRDRAGQMVGGQVEKGEAGEPSQFRLGSNRSVGCPRPGAARADRSVAPSWEGIEPFNPCPSMSSSVTRWMPSSEPTVIPFQDVSAVLAPQLSVAEPARVGCRSSRTVQSSTSWGWSAWLGMIVPFSQTGVAKARWPPSLVGEPEGGGDGREDSQQRSDEAAAARQRQGGQKDDASSFAT